jgi:hypothetical protein
MTYDTIRAGLKLAAIKKPDYKIDKYNLLRLLIDSLEAEGISADVADKIIDRMSQLSRTEKETNKLIEKKKFKAQYTGEQFDWLFGSTLYDIEYDGMIIRTINSEEDGVVTIISYNGGQTLINDWILVEVEEV